MLKKLFIFLIPAILMQNIAAQTTYLSGNDTLGNNSKAGNYLTTRGISLYYEIYGQGQPVLMLHGNGGSINNFSNQIPYFSKNYLVLAVDSRAQGKSTDDADSLSFEMMADDFNALLDSLKLDSCNVLGWSDGGINALLLAIRHPEKVKKLAITGANISPDTTAISPADYWSGLAYCTQLENMAQTPAVRNQLKLALLDAFQPNLTLGQLNQIQCPSLIIGGDHDVILPGHTLLIARSIPHSMLWILPDSGHDTLIRYKEMFNKMVDQFFDTGRFTPD